MWFLQLCLTFLRLSIFGWTNELNAFFPHFALLTPVNHWDFSSDIIASEKSFQKIQAVLHHCLYTLDNTKNFSVPLVPSCFSFGDGCVPQRTYGNVWRHLGGGHNWRGGGVRFSRCVEARDAIIHPTIHRSAPQQQGIIQPQMSILLRLRNAALNKLVILHLLV